MYGLINEIKSIPGQRDALSSILIEGAAGMLGCVSYVVAHDASDPDTIWVTEVWESKERHAASLSTPSVKKAMEKGKPLIAGFGNMVETAPIGGHGLP
jgi:quinol monooxygenase YgiN